MIAFIGDTPAAGLVGGFKEGVGGAFRGCRTCMVKKAELCLKVFLKLVTIANVKALFSIDKVLSAAGKESGKT